MVRSNNTVNKVPIKFEVGDTERMVGAKVDIACNDVMRVRLLFFDSALKVQRDGNHKD